MTIVDCIFSSCDKPGIGHIPPLGTRTGDNYMILAKLCFNLPRKKRELRSLLVPVELVHFLTSEWPCCSSRYNDCEVV